MTPTHKVTAATLAAAVATIATWLLGEAGIDVPEGIDAAITVVLVFAAGWVVPEREEPNGARHQERGAD